MLAERFRRSLTHVSTQSLPNCLMLPRQHQLASSTLGPLKYSTSSDSASAANSQDEICREYIRGNCTKYGQCKYRHELDTNRMKEILQFCHDYQNRNGCSRKNCKFLHATKEEQTTFLTTGQIPRVLAERHAATAAAALNMQSNAETIPQIAMFISESYMQPPPAPWPPLPPSQAVLPPVATAPPPPPPASSPPRHAPGPSSIPPQQMAQPPVSASSAQLTYTAMPQQTSALFSMNQTAPVAVPEKFDPSKPPPPLPSHLQPTNNGQLKRKVDANGNAATCKMRKLDGSEVSEQHCESCGQRELRIDAYKQQMEALHNEEETQILLYKKKLQEYEIGRDILKKLVGPELFSVFDRLIEGAQPPQLDSPSSYNSGSSSVSKEAVLHLFRVLLDGGTRNVIDQVPSTSHMDERLQSLTSMPRRHSVASYSNTAPDLIKYVVDTLRNSGAAERSPSVEHSSEPMVNNRTNGYLANGQKTQTSTSEPARYGAPAGYSGPGVQVADFGARTQQAANYPVAGPSGYTSGAPPLAPPPTGYMYHPAIPPPNRHYYPAVSGTGSMPYNGTERPPGPVPAQGMQPPAAPGALRPAASAPNYNYMARYPQPPYFPPYQ